MIDEKDIEKIISACVHSVRCERGSFYPDKNYGSLLKSGMNKRSVLACVRQATSQLDGVYIKSIDTTDDTLIVDVMINDDERRVEINI